MVAVFCLFLHFIGGIKIGKGGSLLGLKSVQGDQNFCYNDLVELALYYLWFVLVLAFNSENQAVYNCKANSVGACIMNGQIVFACRALVNKSLTW